MKCPYCGSTQIIVNHTENPPNVFVKERVRKCLSCDGYFRTSETLIVDRKLAEFIGTKGSPFVFNLEDDGK